MSDQKDCFVVSPIGDEDSEVRENADEVLDYIIRPVLEEFDYSVTRADKISKSGRITVQVFDELATSDLVIGDLTGLNPNVMYEMGVRLSLGTPFIQLAKEEQDLPFDTSDFRTIFYRTDDLGKAEDAKEQLKQQVEDIENEAEDWDHGIPVDAFSRGQETKNTPHPDGNRKLLMSIKSTLSDILELVKENGEYALFAANASNQILENKEMEREARREEQMMNMMGEIMGSAMQNPEALETLAKFDQDNEQSDASNDGMTGLEKAVRKASEEFDMGQSDE